MTLYMGICPQTTDMSPGVEKSLTTSKKVHVVGCVRVELLFYPLITSVLNPHHHLHNVMSMHFGHFFLQFFLNVLYSWCRLGPTEVISIKKHSSNFISGFRTTPSLILNPVTPNPIFG